MALVKEFCKPDIFLTMTCNPNWKEIKAELLPKKTRQDRPDLVARVFRAKLEQLKEDLLKKEIFGPVQAHVYVVEFQKRGLPHVHFLLIMYPSAKVSASAMFDRIVTAELADKSPGKFQKLILADHKATIFNKDVDKFEVHQQYTISNGIVRECPEKYRIVDNNKQWIINSATLVIRCNDEVDPNVFNFTPFSRLNDFMDSDKKVDIMAAVVDVRPIQQLTLTGGIQQKRELILIDRKLEPVMLTLWDNYVHNEVVKLASAIQKDYPVLICNRIKVVTFGGSSQTTAARLSRVAKDITPKALQPYKTRHGASSSMPKHRGRLPKNSKAASLAAAAVKKARKKLCMDETPQPTLMDSHDAMEEKEEADSLEKGEAHEQIACSTDTTKVDDVVIQAVVPPSNIQVMTCFERLK